MDYAINSKMNTFFRWVNDYQKETEPERHLDRRALPDPAADAAEAGQLLVVEPRQYVHAHRWPPRRSCPTTTSRSRSRSSGDNPLDRNKLGADFTQLYPQANLTNSIPNVNASPISWGLGNPGWHNDGKDYAFTENVSWVKGPHTFKFGFYYNRDDKKQTATWPMNADHQFQFLGCHAARHGQRAGQPDAGQFPELQPEQCGASIPTSASWPMRLMPRTAGRSAKRFTVEYGIRFEHMVPTFTYTSAEALRAAKAPGRCTAWTSASTTPASGRPSI